MYRVQGREHWDWIMVGTRSLLMGRVTLGGGALVGAGSLAVAGECALDVLVAGRRAHIISHHTDL